MLKLSSNGNECKPLLAGEVRFATVDKHHGEALSVMATARLHLAVGLPRRFALRLASTTVVGRCRLTLSNPR